MSEVETLRMGVCGDACLHIAIERDQLKARAERLAEALRDCVDLIDTLTPLEGTTMRKARAALEQENGDG